MPIMDHTFFIADKLRGIPLVSHSLVSRKKVSNEDDKSIITSSSSQTSTATTTTTTTLNRMVEIAKAIQVEKRNVGAVEDKQAASGASRIGKQTTGTGGLLFRPSAMTAATSSLIKKKQPLTSTTTTTRRPSTRKPATASFSKASYVVATTKPMAVATSGPILAKMLMGNPERNLQQVNTQQQIATSTFKPIAASPSLGGGSVRPRDERQQASSAVEYLERDVAVTRATVNFTGPTQQPLTTQPGFQRRTPQAILTSPRYTNKLNDGARAFAGENWTLFNRADGQMSFFEIMVLISSILMVSTVFIVIIFNWIKSIQSK